MSGMHTRHGQSPTTKCPFCVAKFKAPTALQAHALYSHREGFYTCAWCSALIKDESMIQGHARKCPALGSGQEAQIEAFCIAGTTCSICESKFSSHARAIHHYKDIHLHCTYICGGCNKYFHKRENYDHHYADAHGSPSPRVTSSTAQPTEISISKLSSTHRALVVKQFNKKRCLHCKQNFGDLTEISIHFLVEHKTEMLICVECEKGFATKLAFDRHTSGAHTKSLRFSLQHKSITLKDFHNSRCSQCNVTFANSAECKKHFLVKHKAKILACTECNRGFFTVNALKTHPCIPPSRSESTEKRRATRQTASLRFNLTKGGMIVGKSRVGTKSHAAKAFAALFYRGKNQKTAQNSHKGNTSLVTSTMNSEHTIDAQQLENGQPASCTTPTSSKAPQDDIPTEATIPVYTGPLPSMPTLDFFDTEYEQQDYERAPEPEAVGDEDVLILEWNPGTDVKPVIKLEMNMN